MIANRRRCLTTRRRFRSGSGALFILLPVLAAVALAACNGEDEGRLYAREPVGIMGTRSALMVVLPRELQSSSEEILQTAESELRRLEALFSTWIDSSEMSRLNTAPGGERIPLSPEVVEVLRAARHLYRESDGAFDVTARPLMMLWRQAGRVGALPSSEDLATARDSSTWDLLELHEDGATKAEAAVTVDVDGIAKGYAIDRALEVLEASGALGGLVEVGGDLSVFGLGPEGGPWSVGIRSPWTDKSLGRLELTDTAACTSGGYARFIEIEGRRFAEILDPTTGFPVGSESGSAVVSTTVLAPLASTADAWATALTILGLEGLELIPTGSGIEALLIVGDAGNHRVVTTEHFPEM